MIEKRPLRIAFISAILGVIAYIAITSYVNNRPIDMGTNLITGEQIDFTIAGEISKPYAVLLGYKNEVEKMPQSRERTNFIKELDKAIGIGNADSGEISIKEWDKANDKFQKIRDEYGIEEAEKAKEKRNYG